MLILAVIIFPCPKKIYSHSAYSILESLNFASPQSPLQISSFVVNIINGH
jgi:hypothetical protein